MEKKNNQKKFYAAKHLCCKKPFMLQICDVHVNNIFNSILVKTKTNSKYLIGYLDKDIKPLVLIMPERIC